MPGPGELELVCSLDEKTRDRYAQRVEHVQEGFEQVSLDRRAALEADGPEKNSLEREEILLRIALLKYQIDRERVLAVPRTFWQRVTYLFTGDR